MDTFLAIASKRDTRSYADEPVPEEVATRILDAGRLAGSARNRQPWRFLIIESPALREQLADTAFAPDNIRGARLLVAIAGTGAGIDVGRCVQNMLLAAWNDGIVSCPNGLEDPERASDLLRLAGDEKVAIVLSFGYPLTRRPPERRPIEEWSARADRKTLDELVERL